MGSTKTIYEMAKEAGVSIATISRALSPGTRHKVALETLKKIDVLVQKHRYTPSLAARHLTTSKYKTIGVLFPHHEGILLSEYYSNILSGVADSLLASDYRLKMILLKPGQWDRYNFQKGEGIDGLVMTYWRTFFSDASVFKKIQVPCVIINNIEKNIKARFVAGDHFAGGQIAAEYLYNHGHRKIAVLAGWYRSPDAAERLRGFTSFLRSKGIRLSDKDILDVNYEEEKAYQITETIVKERTGTTAIFCMNDRPAYGVLRKLKEMNVPCPGKISVMGYDDDRRSEHSAPSLTTIRVPVYELAKTAAKDLIRCLEGKRTKDFYRSVLLPVSLIERSSVRNI